MKTNTGINTESKKVNQGPINEVILKETDNVTNEVLSIEVTNTLEDEFKDLSIDTGIVRTSNIIQSENEINPNGKYDAFDLTGNEIDISLGFKEGINTYLEKVLKGKISNVKVDENNNDALLELVSFKFFDQKFSLYDIDGQSLIENTNPKALLTLIFTEVGKTLNIFELSPTDEVFMIIDKIAFENATLFDEVNDIIFFSQGKITFNYSTGEFNYYTNAYLADKLTNGAIDLQISHDISDGTKNLLKSSETNIISDDIVNQLFIERVKHQYIVPFDTLDEPFGYSIPFSGVLQPGQSTTLKKILKENEYFFDGTYTGFLFYKARTLEGQNGTLYTNREILTNTDIDKGTTLTTSKKYQCIITNTTADVLHYDINISTYFLKPLYEEITWDDTISKNTYGTKEVKVLSNPDNFVNLNNNNKYKTNKYFQNLEYVDIFKKDYINNHKGHYKQNKITTIANPNLQLLDKIRVEKAFGDNNNKIYEGLIKKIEWSFDAISGMLMTLTLLNFKAVTIIGGIIQIIDSLLQRAPYYDFDIYSDYDSSIVRLSTKFLDLPYTLDKKIFQNNFYNGGNFELDDGTIVINGKLNSKQAYLSNVEYPLDKKIFQNNFYNGGNFNLDPGTIIINGKLNSKQAYLSNVEYPLDKKIFQNNFYEAINFNLDPGSIIINGKLRSKQLYV